MQIISGLILFIKHNVVFAYVDPGTTGMFVGGSLWVIIVAFFSVMCAFSLKYFYSPIKRWFIALCKKIKGK